MDVLSWPHSRRSDCCTDPVPLLQNFASTQGTPGLNYWQTVVEFYYKARTELAAVLSEVLTDGAVTELRGVLSVGSRHSLSRGPAAQSLLGSCQITQCRGDGVLLSLGFGEWNKAFSQPFSHVWQMKSKS
uniref:Uncharacterized protein n=1 Tax=Molossus molossus TaxID=27622 RepID=A0A7J8JVL8_MOLMO|nr:hypothetical protein HJG59_007898 [Molossus molossus]